MHLINKKTFVIETKLPIGNFKNKQILNEHTGELETRPDGDPNYEYFWFAGVAAHPQAALKGILLYMNIWTPYPEQAVRYKDREEAEKVNNLILTPQAGGMVMDWDLCHQAEGRHILIPVDASIMAGTSKAQIDGNGKLNS